MGGIRVFPETDRRLSDLKFNTHLVLRQSSRFSQSLEVDQASMVQAWGFRGNSFWQEFKRVPNTRILSWRLLMTSFLSISELCYGLTDLRRYAGAEGSTVTAPDLEPTEPPIVKEIDDRDSNRS